MSATIPALREGEAAMLSEVALQVLGSAAPEDPWAPLVDGGWIGVGVDEAKGGQGGGVVEAVALLEALGRTAAAVPLLEAVIAAQLAAGAAGADELVERMVTGEVRATVVPTVVSARREDGGYVLTDAPWLVPWAERADIVLALARTDDEVLVVVLPREALRVEPGVNLAREARDRVAPLAPASAAHPLQTRLGDLVALTALLSAARLAGALAATHALTLEYARERRQFGRTIGSFQAVAHALARQTGDVELATAAVDAALAKAGNGAAALTARVVTGTVAPAVAAAAHQAHGAIGVTREYALHRLTLRLWAWPQEFGTTRWWQRCLAGEAAGSDWWLRTAPEAES